MDSARSRLRMRRERSHRMRRERNGSLSVSSNVFSCVSLGVAGAVHQKVEEPPGSQSCAVPQEVLGESLVALVGVPAVVGLLSREPSKTMEVARLSSVLKKEFPELLSACAALPFASGGPPELLTVLQTVGGREGVGWGGGGGYPSMMLYDEPTNQCTFGVDLV